MIVLVVADNTTSLAIRVVLGCGAVGFLFLFVYAYTHPLLPCGLARVVTPTSCPFVAGVCMYRVLCYVIGFNVARWAELSKSKILIKVILGEVG